MASTQRWRVSDAMWRAVEFIISRAGHSHDIMTDKGCRDNIRRRMDTKKLADLRRIDKIFMPEASRQREKAGFTDENSPAIRFVHYTSADAAIKIIQSKRMWMRNTMCMADYSEVLHGFHLTNSFFLNSENNKAFIAALDNTYPEVAKDALFAFSHWWAGQRTETYITSISEHDDSEDQHGRLSMWRAYGGDAARVALVFRLPYATEGSMNLNLLFSPVAYLTEAETHEVFREVIKNLIENVDFLRSVGKQAVVDVAFYMLLAGVICLKHEGFREEREWRAIHVPMVRPSPLMKSSVETVAGVPQTIYHIPLDASCDPAVADLDIGKILDRVIIGPTQYPLAMQRAFRTKLMEAGCSSEVVMSKIPLRT
jgi:hypothetical protein